MFKSYLRIAIRNLLKFKIFSFINISGLAIGMTVCMLMMIYVINEISFENFHENKDRIYRITMDWGSGKVQMKFPGVMPALGPALKEKFPEIENAIRIQPEGNTPALEFDNKKYSEEDVYYSDPDIFNIFSFIMPEGNRNSALSEPFSMVITQKIAKKYFGLLDPMGKSIIYNNQPFKITGVIEDIPINTHLNCQILLSYSSLEAMGRKVEQPWNTWGEDYTYILLRKDAYAGNLSNKIKDLFSANAGEALAPQIKFFAEPLTSIHWDTDFAYDIGPKGNITYVYLFLSASLLILLIACFNFVNLSSSRYLDRIKEVGVRKSIGANRRELVKQFLTESFLIAVSSIVIGIILFEVFYPVLYTYLDTKIVMGAFQLKYFFGIIILMIIFVGLFAGGYPALFLAKFKPAEILSKGIVNIKTKLSFRKILVVSQFSISIILIAGTIIIFKQLDFMLNSDLGFKKENVLMVNFPINSFEAKQKYPVLRDELLNYSNIEYVSGAYTVPGINSNMTMGITKKDDPAEKAVTMQALPADFGFVSSMGLRIISGRDFSKEYSTDASESVILNETAVKYLNYNDPLGKRLLIPSKGKLREASIIGVIKDFHVKSLRNEIKPMLIYINPDIFITMLIKVKPQDSQKTLANIKETWNRVLPNTEFNYKYMEDSYYNLYKSERKIGTLLSIFTSMAIIISCLGLLGLAIFTINKHIKEIGIRKVLGASSSGIVVLLTKQFIKWVILSNIIAWPAAYYLMNKWLQSFAYRVEIGIWIFIISGTIALMIAILTVSIQAMRVASANPVEALRYE